MECFKNFLRFVYDPIKRKMVRLNELENDEEAEHCSQTGRALDDENAYQLALGNIDPRTFKVVANFDPHKPVKLNGRKIVEPHLSIWKSNGQGLKRKLLGTQQKKITSFVPLNNVTDSKIRGIIEQENDVEEAISDENLLGMYIGSSNK